MSDPVSPEEFTALMQTLFGVMLSGARRLAAGVSGGPDSLALAWLLNGWAASQDKQIDALIVDHGLRPEAAKEAGHIHAVLAGFRHVQPHILKWEGGKPESGVQEEARRARYALMRGYCAEHGITHLFLGHHQDDQAETFLFRLAKGSGLDGLAAMRPAQEFEGIVLLRPLLEIPKARLLATCDAQGLEYVRDPSNESEAFARVRLRGAMDVLEAEGLSVKRLSVTAARLARARAALEDITEKAWQKSVLKKDTRQIVLNYKMLKSQPEEITLRIVLKAFSLLRPAEDYAPRMEKVEALTAELMREEPFRKRTLGGLVIARDDKAGEVHIQIEK